MKKGQGVITAILLAGFLSSCVGHKYSVDKEVVSEDYVHKYGVQVDSKEWATRGKNGKVVTTLGSGVTVSKNYVEGVLDGESTYTFPFNTIIAKVETYKNGQLVKELIYYPSKTPEREVVFTQGAPSKIKNWYQNGAVLSEEEFSKGLLMEGTYYTLEHQTEEGVHDGEGVKVNRDSYGLMVNHQRVKKGIVAEEVLFYSNGMPKEIASMQDGYVHGLKKKYLPGGEPDCIEEWNQGIQSGNCIFFANGDKVRECAYLEGQKDGIEKKYNSQGDIVEESTWKKDKRNGPTVSYVTTPPKTTWYFQDRPVSRSQYELFSKVTGNK